MGASFNQFRNHIWGPFLLETYLLTSKYLLTRTIYSQITAILLSLKLVHALPLSFSRLELEFKVCHRRTGRGGGRGGSCPPKKITKSKSRANIQHKSGKKWEIKSQKAKKPAVCCSNKGSRAIFA
jgi:hypothetical protein